MELNQDDFSIFRSFARNLIIAIKNGIFYEPDHPIFVNSLEGLIETLNKWFQAKAVLELGFSHNNLFLDGVSLKNKDAAFGEIAYYLHIRGILSLTIRNGVTVQELTDFIVLIKYDEKTIRKKGGLFHNIPANSNIQVKELDYSNLLSQADEDVPSTEEELWNFLFKSSDFFNNEELPSSKIELLVSFFKDKQKSASLLNRVYKHALRKQADAKMVQAVRTAIHKVCQHLSEYSDESDTKAFKANMMDIISQIHPDLITRLFETTYFGGKDLNLAEEITGDLSDTFIAGFIESLVQNENSMNENLLRIFDRVVPNDKKMEDIVPIVADKLFDKQMARPKSLSQMQTSIEELFRNNPDNQFINEMYRITVDSVLNQKYDSLVYIANLQPLITKFVKSMEVDHFQTEKAKLFLNVLWHENETEHFEKVNQLCKPFFRELLSKRNFEAILEVINFFKTKSSEKENQNPLIASMMNETLTQFLTKTTFKQILSYIPDVDKEKLDQIVDLFEISSQQVIPMLVDDYISAATPKHKEKFLYIFSQIPKKISVELNNRLRSHDPQMINQLYPLFLELDPKQAHHFSREILSKKNVQMRWQIMNQFKPQSREDYEIVFNVFETEKDKELQKKAAIAILKTGNASVIDQLFQITIKKRIRRYFLIPLIELSGTLKINAAFPSLKDIFFKRAILGQKKIETIKVSAIKSMLKINKSETMKLLEFGRNDKSHSIRMICHKLINQQLISEVGNEFLHVD